MDYFSDHISKLIGELSKLPGIGPKSAGRLAFHIIDMPEAEVEELSNALIDAKKNIKYCKTCFTITDEEECPICKSSKRDHSVIMVVENTRDLAAYEKTGKYNGVYHVLHGAISPMLGIGPSDIKLKELVERLRGDIKEVIVATNSSLEGETTAGPDEEAVQSEIISGILELNLAQRLLSDGHQIFNGFHVYVPSVSNFFLNSFSKNSCWFYKENHNQNSKYDSIGKL